MAENAKCFVGQLPDDITDDAIRTVFNTYGRVDSVHLMSGQGRGPKCAFVQYDTEQGARDAIQVLNDQYKFKLDSSVPIKVSIAKPKSDGGGKGGRGGSSWNYDKGGEQGWRGGGRGSWERDNRNEQDTKGADWGQQGADWNSRYKDRSWDQDRPAERHDQGGQQHDTAELEGRKVFVGNLPGDIREDEVNLIFGTYGQVTDVKIIDGKSSGKCGFVTFSAEDAAKTSIQVLHQVYKFRPAAEQAIRVEPVRLNKGGGGSGGGGGDWGLRQAGGVDQFRGPAVKEAGGNKLFVANLPEDIRDDEMRYIFNTYGTVTDVKLLEGKSPDKKSAFVVYSSDDEAREAITALNDVYKFRPHSDAPIKVEYPLRKQRNQGGQQRDNDWDDRQAGNEDSSGSQAPKVFVGQLPLDITEREVETIFATYGQVTSVVVMDGTGSSKIGFVEYSNIEECKVAMSALHDNYKFRPSSEKSIRVSWAKKRQDGKDNRGYNDKGASSWCGGGYNSYDRSYDRSGYDRGGNAGVQGNGAQGNWDAGRDKNRFEEPAGPKLHIGNLPNDITREAIEQVFTTYGPISDIHMMKKEGTQAASFVLYEREEDAKTCLLAMQQGYEIRPGEGNVNVSYARPRQGGGKGRQHPY